MPHRIEFEVTRQAPSLEHYRRGWTPGPTVHNDIVAEPGFDNDGKLVALDASIGADSYSFTFDTSGSPLHFFGRLTGSSSGKEVARSWCWVEYAGGMLTPALLDLVLQRFQLARER